MNIISWNVNGIRAVEKKGFGEFFASSKADILCLQETKADKEQLSESLVNPAGYHSYWSSAEKKGYSGTAIYSKKKLDVSLMDVREFDAEGRVLVARGDAFTLINAYFPNSQDGGKRLGYKLEFCAAMLELCERITTKEKRPLILCGDYNIAHKEIDLARPKENEESPGFLPEERAWMDSFIGAGYIDTFRKAHPTKEQSYTWWSYRAGARERNVGWRIDYFCVNKHAADMVKKSFIMPEIMGSDHCPVQITL